jgi:hypothetical protein
MTISGIMKGVERTLEFMPCRVLGCFVSMAINRNGFPNGNCAAPKG